MGSTAAKDGLCYAAALQGGGDKGAYQAGALKGLFEALPKGEAEWDVFSGVSVGAINTIFAATFPKGDEKQMIDELVDLWVNITPDDIMKEHVGGVTTGTVFKTGIYDNEPLREFIKDKVFEKEVFRETKYGICNLDKANFEVHSYETGDTVDMKHISSVMASSAIPAFFPPEVDETEGHFLIDGGSIWNIDLPSAINACRDLGYEEEQIVVDIILCASAEIATNENIGDHLVMQNLARFQEINAYYTETNDIEKTHIAFPLVEYRSVISPSENLKQGSNFMDFDPEDTQHMLELGYKDA